MLELGPGLSVTVGPLVRGGGGAAVARAVARATEAGFHGVQLSAAMKGIRPRELDRRARRDVLAMLSRQGVMLSGLDLMVPHRDWLNAATQDRAVTAATAAIELAADLGKVPLAMTLPVDRLAEEIRRELVAVADGHGVALAVHGEHDVEALRQWLEAEDQPTLGAAVDPAALLATGQDPGETAIRLSRWLRLARLDDYADAGGGGLSVGGRCAVGEGELDVTAYRAALATCEKLRWAVVELRDLEDVHGAMLRSRRAWGG